MGGGGKRVAVVGGGLGGLSAAISLLAAGYRVALFEKNERLGGKLNLLEVDGFSFDLGPRSSRSPSSSAPSSRGRDGAWRTISRSRPSRPTGATSSRTARSSTS